LTKIHRAAFRVLAQPKSVLSDFGRLKVPNSGKFRRAGSAGRDDRRCCVLASHGVKEPAGWAEREPNPAYPPASGAPWKTPSMRARPPS